MSASIGNKLKALLKRKSINAKEFGKMIGKSEGRVYQYYNETNFYTDTLKEFSVLLNVPMSYWFDDKDAPHSIVNGDKSAASVYGNATVSTSDEKDKEIEHLKQLLEEKERTIQILMSK